MYEFIAKNELPELVPLSIIESIVKNTTVVQQWAGDNR